MAESWQGVEIQSPFWRFYVADGPGVHLTCDHGRFPYPERDLLCIPAWQRFRFHWSRQVVHHYLHVQVDGWTRPAVRACLAAPFVLHAADLATSLRTMTAQFAAATSWAPALELAAGALAQQCLARVLEQMDPTRRERLLPAQQARFTEVLARIERDLTQPLAMADLARKAGLSEKAFISAFHQTFGQTPGRYLADRRLARAMGLLMTGGGTLEQVAKACGYGSRAYFSRVFSHLIGVGPSHYRALGQDRRGEFQRKAADRAPQRC